mgnify:CR=1 FL=1
MRKQEDLIMNINKLRNSLINSELSIAAVARKTKLSRTALHNFINGGSVRESTAKKIDIVLHNLNEDISLSGGHNMEARKIISLQDKTISYQEKELIDLRKKLQASEAEIKFLNIDNHYHTCKYHFRTQVRMRKIFSFKSIERCILSAENTDVLASKLNVSEEDMNYKHLSIGNWHLNNEHPVDKILDKNSLKILKEATSGIPKQAKLFKFTLSSFYLRFDVLYIIENNFCMTQSICKIDWAKDPLITAKNIILHSGKLDQLNQGVDNN